MAEYAQLKAAINAVIKQNGRMEITGEVLNQVLTAMVNSLGRSMGCAGVATPATNPQSPDQNLFYFAVQAGTYVNFNSIVLPAGISVLMWNGTWTAQTWFTIKETPEYQSTDFISAGGVFESQKVDGNAYDISEHFPTDGVDHTNEYTLQGALAKIPENMYKAGMAIKFKESTTHNYMVFSHIGSDTTNFTSINLWQGVANSNELFHSPTAFMRKQIPTVGAVLDEFGTQNVQTLPTPSNATMNRIFVVQSKHPETDNIKTEWITIKVGNTYQWECIGGDTTGIYDLSDAMAVDGEPATYSSLADALAAVPADKKRAGMTLAFIGLRADVYKLTNWKDNAEPIGNAVEVDQIYLYGEKNYTLDELHDMFSSYDGEPIVYPSHVGDTLELYSLNPFTNLYNIQKVELLHNQRTYEQYRFAGTDLNYFANESLWIKETKVPTKNGELDNNRNYTTIEDIDALQPNWENMQNVTWDELVELRDNEQLVDGKFYRITDYVTTVNTSMTNVRSAGHAFDVIVRADAPNVLNENAFAALHDDDDYFANAKLEAWRLKYCLDNDTDRFEWADDTNGKGVIFGMEDEFKNDIPYDFKNLQFKVCKVADGHVGRTGINGKYLCLEGLASSDMPNNITIPDVTDFIWCYTFSTDSTGATEQADSSMKGDTSYVKVNNPNIGKKSLYKNVFFDDAFFLNLKNCEGNVFGGETFGIDANYLRYNVFGGQFSNNIVNMLQRSSIGGVFQRNVIVEASGCSFAGVYWQNYFGARFYYNVLGNEVRRCHFGESVRYLVIDKDYFYDNIIENGNEYLTITSSQTTGSAATLRHIKIAQGVGSGTSEAERKTISHDTVNDTFQTEYKAQASQTILV